ncbi:ABC transporter ATP-binding protein [Lachnospiraceae bacterium C1.1]|nr:ABC transporter ATP-binding protein [Lachnospiraceae bacterium C1.1]
MSDKLLELCHLTKRYEDGVSDKDVIKDLNLELERGEFLCILGPSGCGKTTLIRCIAGFEKYSGEIKVEGKSVSGSGNDRMMIFQDYNQLFPWKTIKKNIQYPMKCSGIKDKALLEERAMELLDIMNLREYADCYPHQLSGGMKQRVAIARGLSTQPKILLMDEPFAALDAQTRNRLQPELLAIQRKTNTTIIFITHNIQESIKLGSRIILFDSKGNLEIDIRNEVPEPRNPATPGYSETWKMLFNALNPDRAAE